MPDDELVLSDLALSDAPVSWRSFSDRVMGGISQEQVTVEEIDRRRCVRLRGEVRLENNGGFIQVALPLEAHGEPLDARGYIGVRLLVYSNGEEYRLHLRTTDCRRPQQYYWAPFIAEARWQLVDLPFAAFQPKGRDTSLDTEALVRLGVVAYGRHFHADVAVARASLYL